MVAPVRERGLKFYLIAICMDNLWVAPVRERGLKFLRWKNFGRMVTSRSRKGAWIEMILMLIMLSCLSSRSRKGAWIEICLAKYGRTK